MIYPRCHPAPLETCVEVALQVAPEGAFAGLLVDRLVDAALGPRPAGDAGAAVDSLPFLRYELVVLAAAGHRLARRSGIPPAALAGERWLVGPSGAGPTTDTGAFLARERLAPPVEAFPSFAAARARVGAGHGIMLAVRHGAREDLQRGALVVLGVDATPIRGLWHASMLGPDRRTPAAWALRRFVATPEATHAMLARAGGVPAERFRPPVHVSLWS